MFGYTADELKALNVIDLYVDPADRDRVLRILKESGRVRDYKLALRRKNGEVIHVLLNIDMVKLDGQDLLFVTERNITEFERIKQRLLESDDNITALLKTAQETVLIVKKDGTILVANEIAAARVGKCANEIAGLSMYCLLPPSIAAYRKDRLEHAVSSCRAVYFEDERDGRYVANTYYPVADADGNVMRVVIVAQDITERKQEEKMLCESAMRLQSVIETVGEGITLSDRSGHFYIYNSMMEAITGYSREEANTCADFLSLLYPEPDRYGDALTGITELILGDECRNSETRIIAKDGQQKILLISSSLVHDKDREMFLTVYRDITEHKRLEEEVLKKNYHLVHLGQLSAGIAHEINNPNNTILASSQMLQSVWEDAARVLMKFYKVNGNFQIGGLPFSTAHEKIAELPSMITACSRRISDIIENLKDYAGGKTKGMNVEVNINETIAGSLVLLNNQIRRFTDNYSVDLEGNLLRVKGSSQALEQVIINLVMNALESLPDRTRGLRISSSYDDNSGFAIIQIADEGIGMSEEIQKQAMDPFFSTKRDRGGVGLGLSISSSIVRNHGGLIEFSSEPGKGTTVIIKLPVL